MPARYSYRSDPAVPSFPDERPVIVYDTECALCSGWARFVLEHDRVGCYRLLPAQSPLGMALYRHYGLSIECFDTNILLEDGLAWFKSDTALRILRGIGLPWALAAAGYLAPRPLRDAAYDLIARNRMRLFGRARTCLTSHPADRERFLA